MVGQLRRLSRGYRQHLSVLAVVLLLSPVVLLARADAGHFAGAAGEESDCPNDDPGDVNAIDGGTTKVKYDNAHVDLVFAMNSVISVHYQPTDLGIVFVTGSSHADVKIRDSDYTNFCGFDWFSGGDVLGMYNCWDIRPNDTCDRSNLRFDEPWVDVTSSLDSRLKLACHEFGHAVGLEHIDAWGSHDQDDCMWSELPDMEQGLGTESVQHINGFYVEP